jgi:membrane protease YdiL (CAAX protease family)
VEKITLQPMGFRESLACFGIPTLLLYIATQLGVPTLSQTTGLPMVVSWFICSGTLVFLPLFGAAFVFYWLEGNPLQISANLVRFRLGQLSWNQLSWTGLGLLGISLLTYGIVAVGQAIIPDFSAQPSFMSAPPLNSNNRWILAAWVPLFFFNILGEGLFWRGYIFPRQELAFGLLLVDVSYSIWRRITDHTHSNYLHHIVRRSENEEYLVRHHHSHLDQRCRVSAGYIWENLIR